MISDERALWQAVLAMAVEDALTGVSASSGTREEKIHQTHHVRLWFTRPNNDFNSVVTMAGLDPQAVRDQMRHKIAAAPSVEELFAHVRPNRKTGGGKFTFNGQSLTLSEWSRQLNVSYATINNRIRSGWTIEDALTTPARNSKRQAPGVGPDFGPSLGTGGGTTAQEITEIDFSMKAA